MFAVTAAGVTAADEIHLVSAADPGMLTSEVPGFARGGGASQDGRYVVFTSNAPNVIPGQSDGNVKNDVFVRDRVTGTTQLVSRTFGSATTAANGVSHEPSISADGRWIAFTSNASNLVAGQTPDSWTDIYLFDRVTGATVLVSKAAGGSTGGNGSSVDPVVSADGNYVLFLSYATNLVPGQTDPGDADVFLYDRATGGMSLVSRASGSPDRTGNGPSDPRWVSADGHTVAFTSRASDLTPDDFNDELDVFLFTTTPPSSFFTVTPCRLLDTRQPQDGPALVSGVPEILTLHGACGIPATARAVAVNVTVTQPTGAGHLTIYSGDASPPVTSTINFSAGQTRANNAILALAFDGTGTLAARPAILGGGSVHVLLDVVGYFE